jgi:hypothetical protein
MHISLFQQIPHQKIDSKFHFIYNSKEEKKFIMVTELEIIDTAIKIGLGAIISGITNYLITKKSHENDLSKSLVSEKKDLLLNCVKKLESGTSYINNCFETVDRLIKLNVPHNDPKFLESLKDLTSAFNKLKEARVLCYLIGQKDLAEYINKYLDLLEQIKQHMYEKQENYDLNLADLNTQKRDEIKQEILNRLNKVLESIYT